MTLQPSRIYTFIDHSHKFSINFFDGQKFVSDCLLLHAENSTESAVQKGSPYDKFFKSSLLSYPHLLSFCKPGEEIGFYIDSDKPKFKFKFESFGHKYARTLLLLDTASTENFSSPSPLISGLLRFQKYLPQGKIPYTTHLQLEQQTHEQAFAELLSKSFQIDAHLLHNSATSSDSSLDSFCQSIFIHKLPPTHPHFSSNMPVQHNNFPGPQIEHNFKINNISDQASSQEFSEAHHGFFEHIFSSQLNQFKDIVDAFELIGFNYLNSKTINLSCTCSLDKITSSLFNMYQGNLNELFGNDTELSINCDYCKKKYLLTKSSFNNFNN